MKRILLFALALVCPAALWGQAASFSTVLYTQGLGNIPRLAVNAPTKVCNSPHTGPSPCTNLATTFTSITGLTQCSAGQGVTVGTNTCSSASDSRGNFGFYGSPGASYDYYFQVNNVWYGPFTVTVGGGSGGGGGGNVSSSGTPSGGQIALWVSSTAINGVTATGDCTVSNLGVILCGKTNGVNFGPFATQSTPCQVGQGCTGTSGTLTGLVRGGNPFNASELSGDVTTSGSNFVNVNALHFTALHLSLGVAPTPGQCLVNTAGLLTGGACGGGSGTVNANSGSVGSPAQYIAAGGSTTVSPSTAWVFVDNNTTGATPCAKITTGLAALSQINNGVVNAWGLTPVSGHNLAGCGAADTNAMVAAANGGRVDLGPYTLWITQNPSAAAIVSGSSFSQPSAGSIPMPNKFSGFRGLGRGDAGGFNTTIAVCTGNGAPVAGCGAPATRHWAISSTTITYAGGRTYLGLNVSGADMAPGEPTLVEGSSVTNNNGAGRACNKNLSNGARTDASCPANTTSSLIYVTWVSGITGISINTAGSGQTPGTYVVNASGGGGSGAQIQVIVAGGGTVVTTPVILNPGKSYTSVPTFTLSAGGTPATFTPTIASACAASCGNLHAEIPILDTTPLSGNQFGQEVEHLAADCNNVPDCIPYRSISGNEQVYAQHVRFAGSSLRQLDIHTFAAQNLGPYLDLELNIGSAASSCTVGTTGFFVADNGPHELEDFTVNMSNCPHTVISCGYVNTNTYGFELHKGHCENAEKDFLFGQDSPAWAWKAQTVAGSTGGTAGCADTTFGPCVPSDGPYQNQNSSVAMVSPNFPAGSTPASTDFALDNLGKGSAAQTDTLEDYMTTNPMTGLAMISNDNIIAHYAVDYNSTVNCTSILTTTPSLPNKSCGGAVFGNGSAAGSVQLGGNTTNPAIATNAVAVNGPLSASFTAYGLNFPATAPAAHSIMQTGAGVSGYSPITFGLLPDCDDAAGQHLNYDQGTDAWSCGTTLPANVAFGTGYAPIPSSDTISAAAVFATTQSVSSSSLAVGSFLVIRAHGVYTTTATASPLFSLRVNAGGTTGICPVSSATTLTTNVTNGYWETECKVQIQTTGNPGTAVAWGAYTSSAANGSSISIKNHSNAGTVSYITTSAQTVSIEETSTLVAGQTFTLQALDVQVRY